MPALGQNNNSSQRIAHVLKRTVDTRFENANTILLRLADALKELPTESEKHHAMVSAWTEIRQTVLLSRDAVETKRHWFALCYAQWNVEKYGQPPVWQADNQRLLKSNTYKLMQVLNIRNYDELYQFSVDKSTIFWSEMMRTLGIKFKNSFIPHPMSIVNVSDPKSPQWFPGGKINITDSFFPVRGDKAAIVYRKEGSIETQTVTYAELNTASNQIASALVQKGFKQGDHIAIDMPMNREAVIAFVGILKMGGTIVSLADSFKETDIALRLQQIPEKVKAIFTQDYTRGNPLYDVIKNIPNAPLAIVAVSNETNKLNLRSNDVLWHKFINAGNKHFNSVTLTADHNLNIIFSSATSTGKAKEGTQLLAPKAIPWKVDAFLKSAVDAHLHHELQADDVLCWPTNLGWMMGSFQIAAALINQSTLAVYDGRPTTREFGRFVQDAKVTVLGLVPAMAESWENSHCMEGLNWSSIKRFSSTGSPSKPENYFYLMSLVPQFAPVIEYMGGTEIGGGYMANTEFRHFTPSSFNTPTLGTPIIIAKQNTSELQKGEVCFPLYHGSRLTPPMGFSTQLLNANHHDKYFEGNLKTADGFLLRRHGDVVALTSNNQYRSVGRTDDMIKINGIKTSSVELEGYIKSAKISLIHDVVVVGIRPPLGIGGEAKVVAFVESNSRYPVDLLQPCKGAISKCNPQLAKLHAVEIVKELPLTANNKVKRQWLADNYLQKHPDLFAQVQTRQERLSFPRSRL